MTRKMLINATHPEEHRVAIVEDGLLTELDIEIAGKEQTRGNIYKASVVRVESSLQAAFVDYGGERLGFLQLGEIHPSYYPSNENGNGRNRPRINEILRPGKELVVQVVKEERGTKGAALTTFLSLAGRYMVLMPESDSKGISRKIENESERKQIKQAMGSLDLPENMGYIVRTAGIGKSAEELKRDFDYLVRIYRTIQERAAQIKAPALIFRESNLIIRCIRDYFSEDMDEVLVDDPQVFGEARDFFQMVMPEHARCVKLHQERRPIFSRYQIEEQIETISQNKVQLPSGGSIVLDSTEALVAVDVNSGKMASEQGLEGTAYKTNMEAAAETARQLRLRDLGGLIVIDFIDMRDRKHIREVEKCLKDALKNDKSRVTVGRISQFGLLEMSRQRIKPTLAAGAYVACPHCQGSGRVKSIEAQGIAFLRRIQTSVAKGQIGRVEGELPIDVAFYLLNEKREELSELERRYDLEIFLSGQDDLLPHESDLNLQKREKQSEKKDEEGVLTPLEVAVIAETALEPAEEAKDETGAHAEGENQGRKKRRRRRRRRKDTPETPAAASTAGADTPDKEAEEKEATTVQPVPSPAEATPQVPEEAQDETPQDKSAPQEHAPPAAASEAQKEVPSETKEETTTEKPKPRRRGGRRPSRKPAAEAAPEASAEGKTTEPESPVVPEEKKETPAQAPAPAPQATDLVPEEKTSLARKAGPDSPQPAQEKAPAEAREAAPQTSAEQPPAEKEKKTAPARRKRTTPARKKAEQPPASEATTEEASAAAAAPQPGTADTENPAEKKKAPARKRRTATPRKSAAKDDKKTSQEAAENVPAKAAEKTADPSTEKEGTAAEAAEKTEKDKARKPDPKRRSTRTSTAAGKKTEEADKPGEPVEKKEEKKKAPPRKTPQRRSTRKKKEEPEKETPAAETKSSGGERSEDTT